MSETNRSTRSATGRTSKRGVGAKAPAKRATRAKPDGARATARAKMPAKAVRAATKSKGSRWSADVMAHSDAMDLKPGVFKLKSARAIAQSLKESAEASRRRKSTPFRSAMSMLTFEINRGGKNLSAARVLMLNNAKKELRRLFDRPAS